MTNGVSLHNGLFELDGHDCPLGSYPSVVVPVGKLAGEIIAVYTGEGKAEFRSVARDSNYNRHNDATASTLRGFDPVRYGLFAFSEKDIVIYDLGRERPFYSRLLRSSAAFDIEPFYRLSLAIETEESSLIRPVYFSCAKHLARDAPEFTEGWMKAIELVSPLTATIQGEWLRRVEHPRTKWIQAAISTTSSVLEIDSTDLRTPGTSIGPEMNSAMIARALKRLTLDELSLKINSGDAYATAIRTSLGFTDSELREAGALAPSEIGYERVPSSEEVAATSGLSLTHLEFRNIILSKATAVEFLEFSASGLPTGFLSHEVFRPGVYERHFNRRAVKIKRRQVFTYAEVLSLIGYRGPIEPPTWS